MQYTKPTALNFLSKLKSDQIELGEHTQIIDITNILKPRTDRGRRKTVNGFTDKPFN